MLNLQHIRERLGPDFQPFTISLSDGRTFLIPHRDFIAVGRGLVSVIDQSDIQHTIDALHIVSIDDSVSQPNSNGT
jgi:hypothetical protein